MSRSVYSLTSHWEFSSGTQPAPAGSGLNVDLPHDWAINRSMNPTMEWGVDQAFRDWWGIGWYRRTLHIDQVQATMRYVLDCDGIYEQSQIQVNGVTVGGQQYGYSPFMVDITDAIHDGDNEILIRVENLDAPTDRWYSGAGIYRNIELVVVPQLHLDTREVVVTQHFSNQSDGSVSTNAEVELHIDTHLTAKQLEEAQVELCAQLYDADGTCVTKVTRSNGVIELPLSHVRRWSADDPYLYTLQLQLVDRATGDITDNIAIPTGIRQVVFDVEHGMLVNGKPTIFRGVCLHQDGGCVGSATTKSLLRARLEQLKAMGCNGLRLAHHAHPKFMLDLADEMGFYVYAEPFDKWQSGHYKRYFDQGWHHDLAAMITRDRNRPSVVMWGVGNEVENQAKRSMLTILEQLVNAAHELDTTRPVGCAMSPHFQYESADVSASEGIIQATDETPADAEIEDPAERVERIAKIAAITDITVLNYAEQWYERVHEAVPDKPIFGSEVYQWFVGHDLQMQDYISENPNLVPERLPYVIGGAIWAGFDYLGESMGWPSKGWSGALIRTNGVPKAGYWLMKSYWQPDGEPFVHFMVADYSWPDENIKEHWDIPPFIHHWHFPSVHKAVLPYMITTNCDEVRIELPQRTLYVKPVREFPNRVVTGYLPYQPGTITVIGYRGGVEVCRESTTTPVSPAVNLQFTNTTCMKPLDETLTLDSSADTRMLLSVQGYDTANNPVLRESAPVRFTAEGPMRILGVDNGNLMSNEPYGNTSIHMHQGVASVMLQPTGQGRCVIRASAPGMHEAHIVVINQ